MKEENDNNNDVDKESVKSQPIDSTLTKEEQLLKEKLEELRKRDPFIYT
jgi:hypothetical protein